MSKFIFVLLMVSCLAGATPPFAAETAAPLPEIPSKDQVTMLNVGVEICLSCQRMMSIIKELEREYRGKVAVIYVELPKHREVSAKYELRSVPTQIFFDKGGKEKFRHEGYLSKKRCVGVLEKMGVKR